MELLLMVPALILTQAGQVRAQAEGLRLVASGDLSGAEVALTQTITSAPNQKPTVSGLETEFAPGRPLALALRRYRAAFTPEGGGAAAFNNRAAVRVSLRNFEGALQDADQAILRSPDWGLPWVNAALAWLGKGDANKALASIKTAIDQGENTALAYAVLAEAEIEAGQLAAAREDLKVAADRDGTLPYLLTVRAKLLHRQSRVMEGERAFLQALSQVPRVTTDQFHTTGFKESRSSGGAVEEALLKVRQVGQVGESLYRVNAGLIRQQVEGRVNAYQGRNELGAVFGTATQGMLVGSFLDEFGGRPGGVGLILPSAPAQYGFQRSALALQKSLGLGAGGTLALQAAFRHNAVRIQPSAATSITTIQDDVLNLEAQLRQADWTAGAAWTQIKRKTDYVFPIYLIASPVEPLEQVTPNGTTVQGLIYALHRRKLSRFVELNAGPVLASRQGSSQVQALADLAVRLTDHKTVHLRTTPYLVTAASDLFPAAITSPPQANLVDQDRESVNGFNRDPFLPGVAGRFLRQELGLDQIVHRTLHVDTRLFRNELFQYFAQSVDPRLSSVLAVTRAVGPERALLATPISQGKATGLTQRVRWEATPKLSLGGSVTYQETRALIPVRSGVLKRLPHIPQWQGTLEAGLQVGQWNVAAEGFYVGKRPFVTTFVENPVFPPMSLASTARETAGLNLRLRGAVGSQFTVTLSALNLGRAQLYPGFATQTAYVLGLSRPF